MAAVMVTAEGGASVPSSMDVITMPGPTRGESLCRSRRDERPVPVTVGGRGEQYAGSQAHKALHREQRRGSSKCAAREMSVPVWGKGGMHRGHGRAEKYEHQAVYWSEAASAILTSVTGLASTQ